MTAKVEDWHCKSEHYCPGGNCPGCRDGKRWCTDPRCAPYCANCNLPKHRDRITNYIMFTLFVAMLAIFFLVTLWLLYPTRYVYVPNRLTVDPQYGENRASAVQY